MENIYEIVEWWRSKCGSISDKEGWSILTRGLIPREGKDMIFIIMPISIIIEPTSSNFYEKRELAKCWGWILGNDGKIIGFDKKRFDKVKHLIPANELGLL